MKYYIKTFGCAANEADSERIAALYESRGYTAARSIKSADDVIINTCMIRASAEHRVYGLVHNLTLEKKSGRNVKIVVTGCMVGMAARDKSGKMLTKLSRMLPGVDEFLPIEEVGFDYAPIRTNASHGWVPISNGCNNFCTFCVVPFTRGREISRPLEDVVAQCRDLISQGIHDITLVGQNVNSYGADLIMGADNVQVLRDMTDKTYFDVKQTLAMKKHSMNVGGFDVTPTYVRHLGRLRIPTLFPALLKILCDLGGIRRLDFISSNPWDFSDDLIAVMKENPIIARDIHLPVQAGDNEVLRRMNRWYTREEYMDLVARIRKSMPDARISTDIIVGFCGETEAQFNNTLDLCERVGFSKAYVAMYSDRGITAAHSAFSDDVPRKEKKRRWLLLEEYINRTNLRRGTYPVNRA